MSEAPSHAQQLAAVHLRFERAARIYCQHNNLDPDQQMQLHSNVKPRLIGAPSPVVTVARWRLIAEELYDLSLRLTAMRDASREQAATLAPAS